MMKHIEFENGLGKKVRGYLHMPECFDGEVVVMYHGFTGNKTEHACHFRNIARILEENNIASLRMDFSGNGESDGDFKDFTFDTMMKEAQLMLEFAKTLEGVKSVTVLGFSMGGAVAAMIAKNNYKDVSKLVLWSPAGNIINVIKERFETLPKKENGNVVFSSFELSKEMYESVDKYNTYDGLEIFTNPVLILHGFKDQSVPYLYGARYAVSFYNSHIYFIKDAGHGYDDDQSKEMLYAKTLEFLKN